MKISNKKIIRKDILAKRNNLDDLNKLNMDRIIEEKFLNSDYYKNSKNIFIYISYSSEINTKNIIEHALKSGKNIYVPRIDDKLKLMDAVKIETINNLSENKYGILEPEKDEQCVNPDCLDLIVVPGVAFDKRGGRMGYGAGYYDRYFKKISKEKNKIIKKVALSYDLQIIKEVPMDENDEFIDCIITNKETIQL